MSKFENSETENLTNKILDLFFEFDVRKSSSLQRKNYFSFQNAKWPTKYGILKLI